MKKYFLTVLGLIALGALVLGAFGNTYAVNEEVEHPAAPAIAGLLLEEAGIDSRYGTGRDGGNYISDVARNMAPDTDFNGVSKNDVVAYSCAVASFLKEKGADVNSPYSGQFDPYASGATATDHANGTVTLAITVKDLCGDGIPELNPLGDFYVMDSVIGGPYYFGTSSIPGSEANEWEEVDGIYEVTLERNFFNSRPAGYVDGWYRIWDIYVLGELVEDNLKLHTTYYMVGDWKMDLYVGATLHQRFVVIATHEDGDITGLFGIGYDPDGIATGTITGTVEGQTLYMFYDRKPIAYTAEFNGTISVDGNSASGTWSDSGTIVNQNWNMVR